MTDVLLRTASRHDNRAHLMLAGFSAFGLFEKDGVVSREDLGQVLAQPRALPHSFFSSIPSIAEFVIFALVSANTYRQQVLRAIGVNPTEVCPISP